MSSELDYLSKVSGVDFVALREKYSKQKTYASAREQIEVTNHVVPLSEEERKNIDTTLSKYHICKNCNGLGVVKSVYNHMTMERTCEECDGESIILQSQFDKVVANTSK